MLKSQSRLLANYKRSNEVKSCLRSVPFPHLDLSSRHGFRSYISSLSLLAVEYDLAVSSDSLLCRCSYYNNSVHELQVFESIYKGLKETTPGSVSSAILAAAYRNYFSQRLLRRHRIHPMTALHMFPP